MMRLIITEGDESRVFETAEPVVTVGRGAESTVHITDEAASRDHCRIQRSPEGPWTVTDLASRNGTRLNGQIIDEEPLKPGDKILIGKTTILVETLPEDAPAPADELDEAKTDAVEAPPQALRLVFVSGPNRGQTYLAYRKITSIGRRRRDNDIAVFDTGISNRHAEIRRGPDGFVLVDEGSKNGTVLNGKPVHRSPIMVGDCIQLGSTTIEVRAADDAAPPIPPEPVAAPAEPAPAEPAPAVPAPVEPAPAPTEPLRMPGPPAATTEPPATAPQPASVGHATEAMAAVPTSRRRILLLSVAIGVAVVAFAAVHLVRILGARSRQRPPGPLRGVTTREKVPGEGEQRPPLGTRVASSGAVRPGPTAQSKRAEAELADAERLAGEKQYAEAVRRFEQIAQRYAGLAEADRARKRAAEVADEAKGVLDGALRVLRRAELTELPADFDAARTALEAAGAPLKGTGLERELPKALERVQAGRQTAADRRRDAEATALLAAAKEHQIRKEPHIARLVCRELLARFPDSPAAADAKALLESLESTLPAPKEK
jgi:pSer/pThr/pTyr-binding forkhead associated (FHA) protein